MASRKSFAAGIGRKAIVRSTMQFLVIFFDNIETFQLVTLTAKSRRARDQLDHIPRLVVKYKQAILAASYEGTFARATSAVRVTQPISSMISTLDQGWSPRCESEPASNTRIGQ